MHSFEELKKYLSKNKAVFAHILVTEGIFSSNLIHYFWSNPAIFDWKKHVIIVEGSNVLEPVHYPNVCYIDSLSSHAAYIMKEIQTNVDHFIVHNLDLDVCLSMEASVAQKVIWRTWGSDMNFSLSYVPTLRTKLKRIQMRVKWELRAKKVIKNFEAIGLSSTGCDRLLLEKQHIHLPQFIIPYPTKFTAEDIPEILKTTFDGATKSKDEIWIMIGHSANSALKHIKYLNILSHLKDENIKILMPMVYGRIPYRDKVAQHAKSIYGNKAIIWSKRLLYEDYIRMLNLVDICIFEPKHQMALGNMVDLLMLGKMLFIHPKSIVYKTLVSEGIRIHSLKELKHISFVKLEEMLQKHNPQSGMKYAYKKRSKAFIDENWLKLIAHFDRYR